MSPESRAKISAARMGKPLSQAHRDAISRAQQKRERQVFFQRSSDGRWLVMGRGGRTFLWYRIVMSNEIGRELTPSEVVHHINGDPSDDRLENLEVTTNSAHCRVHHEQGDSYRFSDEDRARAQARLREIERPRDADGRFLDRPAPAEHLFGADEYRRGHWDEAA